MGNSQRFISSRPTRRGSLLSSLMVFLPVEEIKKHHHPALVVLVLSHHSSSE